jgi:hypothetical protein
MNTAQALLLPVVPCSLLAVAFLPTADSVSFRPAEGLSLTRTIEVTMQAELDDMETSMNGNPMPMPGDVSMTMTMSQAFTIVDTYGAVSDGGVGSINRLYQTLDAGGSFAMEMPMQEPTEMDIDSSSDLEGKRVLFTKSDSGYEASFPEGEGDDELLEGLEWNMDLTMLLKDGDVEVDETWDIDPNKLRILFMPGGDLKLRPDTDMDMGGMPGMDSGMGNLADMFGEVTGDAKATYVGMRDVEGTQCAVIQIALDISTANDLTDKVADAMSEQEMPEGMSMSVESMDVELSMEGEGTLLWNVGAGVAHSLQISATTTSLTDMAMAMDMQGQKMSIENSMTMSGKYDIKMAFSAE